MENGGVAHRGDVIVIRDLTNQSKDVTAIVSLGAVVAGIQPLTKIGYR